MKVSRVNPWLLAAVALATVALPVSAAVTPKPAVHEAGAFNESVRERAERLAEAATGRFSTLMEEPREPAERAAVEGEGGIISAVVDWLERAARDYQSRVIDKLSVSADAGAGGESGDGPGIGIGAWLKDTVRSAFGWLQGWVSAGDDGSEYEKARPKALSAPAESTRDAEAKKDPQQVASNDRTDADARDFVEARRKADEERKEAQRLAEVREKTAEEKRRAEADKARRKEEAGLKAREDARKADLARKHEENQRRINESLRKLDEAHAAAEAKRREAERAKEDEAKKTADRRAALEAEKAAEEKHVADETSRKAAEEQRMLALTAPPAKGTPEGAAAPNTGAAPAAPSVRANVFPELRLPSPLKKAGEEKSTLVPDGASEKSAPGAKTAANEPPAAVEPKASESVASDTKPKAERGKSAERRATKRAKAQRRTREAKALRRRSKLVYVVKPGDTLTGIAKRYLGNRRHYDVIYRANRHKIKNPDVIQAYQRIIVPLRKA